MEIPSLSGKRTTQKDFFPRSIIHKLVPLGINHRTLFGNLHLQSVQDALQGMSSPSCMPGPNTKFDCAGNGARQPTAFITSNGRQLQVRQWILTLSNVQNACMAWETGDRLYLKRRLSPTRRLKTLGLPQNNKYCAYSDRHRTAAMWTDIYEYAPAH
jgi:hypothetical protein